MNITTEAIAAQKATTEELWQKFLAIEKKNAPAVEEINRARSEWCQSWDRVKALELPGKLQVDQTRDEPTVYQRGELPPRDARDEHDKSL